ncbi:hypothetical protein BAC2_03581 [uncultured bacterium]|nr:hypothetical protein BAC2_03581 [uncultured bacterium]
MKANAPNIGKPGTGWDEAKEQRWAAGREESRIRFATAVQHALTAGGDTARHLLFDRYGRQHGPHALQTLQGVVAHRLAQKVNP